MVDTCRSYGDGRGFARLRTWHQRNPGARFEVVLKVGRPVIEGVPRSGCDVSQLIDQAQNERELLDGAAVVLVKDPPEELFHQGRLQRTLEHLAAHFVGLRVGVASHRLDACAKLPAAPGFIAQLEVNALNRWVSGPAASGLSERGWEVWAMQPLAYGFLGRCEPRSFPANDWRSRLPDEVVNRMRLGALGFHRALAPDFPDHGVAHYALGYCLRHPAISRVVIGPRTIAQLRDVFTAAELARRPEFELAMARL